MTFRADMIEKAIHGTPFQTVMTVSERVFVLGKIITRYPNTVTALEIMGMVFAYEEQTKPRGYQMAKVHFLRGVDWETKMTTLMFQPEFDNEGSWPSRRVYKNVPPYVVRWGKERFLEVTDVDFSGNDDTFKANMLYAKMIGADLEDWQGTVDALT